MSFGWLVFNKALGKFKLPDFHEYKTSYYVCEEFIGIWAGSWTRGLFCTYPMSWSTRKCLGLRYQGVLSPWRVVSPGTSECLQTLLTFRAAPKMKVWESWSSPQEFLGLEYPMLPSGKCLPQSNMWRSTVKGLSEKINDSVMHGGVTEIALSLNRVPKHTKWFRISSW